MADTDKDDRVYEYNGSRQYLKSQTLWTRTGYTGKRTYNKLGSLSAHPVGYQKTITLNRNRITTGPGSTGSPVESPVFRYPGWFESRAGVYTRDLINQATIDFYSKAANTNSLLPLMLKERQQTIDMVTEKVLKLVAIKRNFLRELRKSWKGNDHTIVQNRWLEYRYGWLPTLADINTLCNQPLGLPGTVVSGSAMRRYASDGFKTGEWTLNQNGSVHVKVQAILIPKDPFMKTASQYGIANPALVVWELVPYSFAVDWIFNIGGYLEHLGALNGLEMIDPFTSERHNFHQESYCKSRWGLSSGYGSYKGVIGGRTLGVPPYPNPFIPSNGMNLVRFFDAAALLKGQFDRFMR